MSELLPILYSLARCPYAMRARFALIAAQKYVIIRNVKMHALPEHLRQVSPKATVPVLITANNCIIDESWSIMLWALEQNDPLGLLTKDSVKRETHIQQVTRFDNEFIEILDRYKVASRYHHDDKLMLQSDCWSFLHAFSTPLKQHKFLVSDQMSIVDLAVMPFIRQLSQVDKLYFKTHASFELQQWLMTLINHPIYVYALKPYPQWFSGDDKQIMALPAHNKK